MMLLQRPRILIGDDHGMIRQGISLLIQMEIGKYYIAEADSCAKVMSQLNKGNFSHLIIDVIFGDGNSLEILPNIKRLYPGLNILIFSMQPAEVYEDAFRQISINYFLSKTTDNPTVVKELTHFLNNFKKVEEIIPEENSAINPFKSLTPRELQVLHYMLNGLGTKQISETLNLKMSSVSTLKKRIYFKTDTSNFKSLIDLCTRYRVSF